MKIWKTAILVILSLFATARLPAMAQDMVAPTQAVFGNVAPVVPEGWVKRVRGNGVIVFSCPQANCKESGEIAYSAMIEADDSEAQLRAAVRQNRNYIKEMGNRVARASNGELRQVSFKDTSDARMIRFERVFIKQNGRGKEYYIMYRTIAGNQSRIVSATAPTLAKAREYIRNGIASFPR